MEEDDFLSYNKFQQIKINEMKIRQDFEERMKAKRNEKKKKKVEINEDSVNLDVD
jgi:hypothetical protein